MEDGGEPLKPPTTSLPAFWLADTQVSTPAPAAAGTSMTVAPARERRSSRPACSLVSVPLGGEHFRRRPIELVEAAGLRVEEHDRFALGIVERLAARKPTG
jgi:hypothetical protein